MIKNLEKDLDVEMSTSLFKNAWPNDVDRQFSALLAASVIFASIFAAVKLCCMCFLP